MSDFALAWSLSRSRFIDTIKDLNAAQLNYRLHPQALTIGEMALHVAGVEVSFASQLLGLELDEEGKRLKAAATDGSVNDKPFPFSMDEITPDNVMAKLDYARSLVEPMISNPSDGVLQKEIVSALGPVITGQGAMARFAFHAGYHQGQAYLIRTAPEFPA